MATTVVTPPVGDQAPTAPVQGLGLTSATTLVVGSIIGTGVFTMPAVMAGAGTVSILTLAVISVCAVLLGVMFGQLTRRTPRAMGGCTRTPGTSSVTSPVS